MKHHGINYKQFYSWIRTNYEQTSSIAASCCLQSIGCLTMVSASVADASSPRASAIDLIFSIRNFPSAKKLL